MLNLRFDIDTRRGLLHGVPPLLDVLERHGLRASFFCVMGPEANLWEIVRLRFMADSSMKSKMVASQRGGRLSLLRQAAFPGVVGSAHPDRLREIVERGHELQPHGWSHIQWQRNHENIDARAHLSRAMNALGAITGQPVTGWAAPGRTVNDDTLEAYDEAGLAYSCDLDGEAPFRPSGRSHLQMPITHFETVAQMRARGLTDDGIVETYIADVEANPAYCSLFEHPDDLTDAELAIFDRLFAHIVASGRQTHTLGEIAASY